MNKKQLKIWIGKLEKIVSQQPYIHDLEAMSHWKAEYKRIKRRIKELLT